MIYFHLSGRLGNQLFIWASSLQITEPRKNRVLFCQDRSIKNDPEVDGDFLEFLEYIGQRNAITDKNFQSWILQLYDFINNRSSVLGRIVCSLFKLGLQKGPYEYFEFSKPTKRIYRGFFQNVTAMQKVLPKAIELIERYCNEIFQTSMVFKKNPILQGDYQVIHLRRGDYLGTPFGVLDFSYYKKLLRKDLPLVICSDDSSQISKYCDFFHTQYVFTPLNSSAWEALTIISRAKSVLSSNSTLSWWGAAIANKNSYEVFLPEPWLESLAVPTENFLLTGMTKSKSLFEVSEV